MKDSPQETFRWAAHTGGLAVVKTKDYEAGEEIEASNPYEIWKCLSASPRPLRSGDLIEQLVDDLSMPARMWITKYIGFEPAQWFVPAPIAAEALPAAGNTLA